MRALHQPDLGADRHRCPRSAIQRWQCGRAPGSGTAGQRRSAAPGDGPRRPAAGFQRPVSGGLSAVCIRISPRHRSSDRMDRTVAACGYRSKPSRCSGSARGRDSGSGTAPRWLVVLRPLPGGGFGKPCLVRSTPAMRRWALPTLYRWRPCGIVRKIPHRRREPCRTAWSVRRRPWLWSVSR